jgi:hypothetical protein
VLIPVVFETEELFILQFNHVAGEAFGFRADQSVLGVQLQA